MRLFRFRSSCCGGIPVFELAGYVAHRVGVASGVATVEAVVVEALVVLCVADFTSPGPCVACKPVMDVFSQDFRPECSRFELAYFVSHGCNIAQAIPVSQVRKVSILSQ